MTAIARRIKMWPFESDFNFRERYMLINLEKRESSAVAPERLAEVFAEMNSESMAIFFNRLADIEKDWFKAGGGGWPMQLQYITDSSVLEDPARRLMEMIGEYAQPLAPNNE